MSEIRPGDMVAGERVLFVHPPYVPDPRFTATAQVAPQRPGESYRAYEARVEIAKMQATSRVVTRVGGPGASGGVFRGSPPVLISYRDANGVERQTGAAEDPAAARLRNAMSGGSVIDNAAATTAPTPPPAEETSTAAQDLPPPSARSSDEAPSAPSTPPPAETRNRAMMDRDVLAEPPYPNPTEATLDRYTGPVDSPRDAEFAVRQTLMALHGFDYVNSESGKAQITRSAKLTYPWVYSVAVSAASTPSGQSSAAYASTPISFIDKPPYGPYPDLNASSGFVQTREQSQAVQAAQSQLFLEKGIRPSSPGSLALARQRAMQANPELFGAPAGTAPIVATPEVVSAEERARRAALFEGRGPLERGGQIAGPLDEPPAIEPAPAAGTTQGATPNARTLAVARADADLEAALAAPAEARASDPNLPPIVLAPAVTPTVRAAAAERAYTEVESRRGPVYAASPEGCNEVAKQAQDELEAALAAPVAGGATDYNPQTVAAQSAALDLSYRDLQARKGPIYADSSAGRAEAVANAQRAKPELFNITPPRLMQSSLDDPPKIETAPDLNPYKYVPGEDTFVNPFISEENYLLFAAGKREAGEYVPSREQLHEVVRRGTSEQDAAPYLPTPDEINTDGLTPAQTYEVYKQQLELETVAKEAARKLAVKDLYSAESETGVLDRQQQLAERRHRGGPVDELELAEMAINYETIKQERLAEGGEEPSIEEFRALRAREGLAAKDAWSEEEKKIQAEQAVQASSRQAAQENSNEEQQTLTPEVVLSERQAQMKRAADASYSLSEEDYQHELENYRRESGLDLSRANTAEKQRRLRQAIADEATAWANELFSLTYLDVRGAFYKVQLLDQSGNARGVYAIEELNRNARDDEMGQLEAPILINSVETTQNDIISQMSCLNNTKVLYTFGQSFGNVAVGGEVLLGPLGNMPTGEKGGTRRLLDFFWTYRVSVYERPITVSINGEAFYMYLTGLKLGAVDRELHILPFVLVGTLLDLSREAVKNGSGGVNPASLVETDSGLEQGLVIAEQFLPEVGQMGQAGSGAAAEAAARLSTGEPANGEFEGSDGLPALTTPAKVRDAFRAGRDKQLHDDFNKPEVDPLADLPGDTAAEAAFKAYDRQRRDRESPNKLAVNYYLNDLETNSPVEQRKRAEELDQKRTASRNADATTAALRDLERHPIRGTTISRDQEQKLALAAEGQGYMEWDAADASEGDSDYKKEVFRRAYEKNPKLFEGHPGLTDVSKIPTVAPGVIDADTFRLQQLQAEAAGRASEKRNTVYTGGGAYGSAKPIPATPYDDDQLVAYKRKVYEADKELPARMAALERKASAGNEADRTTYNKFATEFGYAQVKPRTP